MHLLSCSPFEALFSSSKSFLFFQSIFLASSQFRFSSSSHFRDSNLLYLGVKFCSEYCKLHERSAHLSKLALFFLQLFPLFLQRPRFLLQCRPPFLHFFFPPRNFLLLFSQRLCRLLSAADSSVQLSLPCSKFGALVL